MPSNLIPIVARLKTTIETATSAPVETWPLDPDAWMEAVRVSASSRLPIFHLAPVSSNQAEEEYTDGQIKEETTMRITGLFSFSGSNLDRLLTIRDSILDAVLSVSEIDLGGLADTVDFREWGVLDQHDDIQAFYIELVVNHSWERV